jgi:threonine synthase
MMKELGIIDRYPRLAVAQAAAANPLYRAWTEGKKEVAAVKAQPTLATAIQINNPVSSSRALRALEAMNGVVEQATEEELAEAAARADRTGMYACPHTAVALAVLEKLLARGVIDRKARTVVISTASGLKFTEFKVRYHEKSLPGLSSSLANPPVNLPADFDKVVEAIEKHHRTS